MAYIPTIHTFEDDVNENRGFDEAPISGGVDRYSSSSSMLVTEKDESSTTKKVLTFISVFLVIASLVLVGYYFYSKYKTKQEQDKLNAEILAKQQIPSDNTLNDLSKILPRLAPGISPYLSEATMKNNIIVLTIKDNLGNTDNYSGLYAYILAHEKDLNSDLYYAFKIEDLQSESQIDTRTSDSSSDMQTFNSASSTSSNKIPDGSYISNPIIISPDALTWENKTLDNQDLEIANAGVTTLVYGYANHKYMIITTYIKDYLDTIKTLE